MGLDTECDLVLDADDSTPALAPGHRRASATACWPSTWASRPAPSPTRWPRSGSLIAAVDALATARVPTRARWRRCRDPRRPTAPRPRPRPMSGLAFLDGLACDPERPAPEQLLATFVPDAACAARSAAR